MSRKLTRSTGFTLVEVMIVVSIIGLLASIAVPGMIRARSRAQENTCMDNLRLLDGAKQSGGRRVDIAGTANAGKALQQIADDLLAQYLVTYELPAGTKREQRLNVSTTRHGVSLRAPTAIPDR